MADKSPRQTMSKKKTGKSIKEKRIDRKAKTDDKSQTDPVTRAKGR